MDTYLIFTWFLRFSTFLHLGFTLMTFLVGIYAFKMYKLAHKNELKLFSLAFLLFSLSYLIAFILDMSVIMNITRHGKGLIITTVPSALRAIALLTFAMLFVFGLVLLCYMTFKACRKSILLLLLGLTIIPIALDKNPIMLFHVISSVLLGYLVFFYLCNYTSNKHFSSFLVLLAFIFLFFGHLQLIFSVKYAMFYVLGDMLELVAYLFILANLVLINRKHVKK